MEHFKYYLNKTIEEQQSVFPKKKTDIRSGDNRPIWMPPSSEEMQQVSKNKTGNALVPSSHIKPDKLDFNSGEKVNLDLEDYAEHEAEYAESEHHDADIDGDGNVGVEEMLAIIAAWGPCDGCPEDLNNDGVVDVADMLIVIAQWGPVGTETGPDRAKALRMAPFANPYAFKGITSDRLLHYTDDEKPQDGPIGWVGL